jgi:ABC-2 type transport system ATP-binding protein
VAVDGLDLEVYSAECFGLLGPNGAGKTTTIEICEGLNTPDDGDVLVLGRHWGENDRELRELLGISLQETQFSEKLTVEETVHLFHSFYRQGVSPESVIQMVQLQEKSRSRVGTLSGGQKQRLALACALVGDPELLFLDEPTTGLDPQSRRQLWELIEGFKSDGRSILLTTHYMEEAERLCDRVAIVDHGRMIALGTPAELISQLSAEHVLEFALTGAGSIDENGLTRIDGVRTATRRNGTYHLQVEELHRAMPALLQELRRQGVQLAELKTHSASLEDVFVSLTGRHLRDD